MGLLCPSLFLHIPILLRHLSENNKSHKQTKSRKYCMPTDKHKNSVTNRLSPSHFLNT